MTADAPTRTEGTAGDRYRASGRRKKIALVLTAVLCVLVLLVDVACGPARLTLCEVCSILLSPDSAGEQAHVIVWSLRLPCALMALVVGTALGVAGAEMQTVLNNPLASPFTLGVSAAAGFGAALALVCGLGSAWAGAAAVPVSAFVFALLCTLAVYLIARLKRGTAEIIVLAGIALLFLFNAGIAFLQYMATQEQLHSIVFWLFGSLARATWPKVGLVAGVLVVTVPWIAVDAWRLTALRLGESRARSLGVNVERLRLRMLILISILTAAAVCFVGAIGFVGLVAPHLARIAVGEDQRWFMPCSALIGAIMLSSASVAGKLLVPEVAFPIGIVTAFMGVPFFLAMIVGKRKAYWS